MYLCVLCRYLVQCEYVNILKSSHQHSSGQLFTSKLVSCALCVVVIVVHVCLSLVSCGVLELLHVLWAVSIVTAIAVTHGVAQVDWQTRGLLPPGHAHVWQEDRAACARQGFKLV